MNQHPLRYKIASWDEVGHIRSNNNPKLKLQTARILGPDLHGLVIRVNHEDYGCLFSTLINAYGPLLTQPNMAYDLLTTDDILQELHRFGFEVIYSPEDNLDGEQLNYLMTLQTLGFSKLRLLGVTSHDYVRAEKVDLKLIAFDPVKVPDWLNNLYQATQEEYLKALEQGAAINLTERNEYTEFDWSFLLDTQVVGIEDVLKNNS